MTSAQSRQPLLSGSNILWLSIIVYVTLGLVSCAKRVVMMPKGTDVQVIVPDKNEEQSPDNQKNDNNPDTPTEPSKNRNDTPATTNPNGTSNPVQGAEYQSRYSVKLLLPLKPTSSADLSSAKYVQYYAGILQALAKLNEEQIKLDVKVYDTESNDVKSNLSEILNAETDLVIGPYERDDVKSLVEACKQSQIPLISPWHTSSKSTTDNPYYIQLKPNLKEHFKKLALSVVSDYRKGEIVIIGKDNADTKAWIEYFQSIAKERTGESNFFASGYVSEAAVSGGGKVYGGIINGTIKAVVFPNYNFSDENYLSNALHKLLSEKSRGIAVYGMPVMYESDKIDFEYYHSLNIRIVISDFVEENHQDITNFRREFYEKYGEIPTVDAIKGYDMMLYFGRNLWKYGRRFQYNLEAEPETYLQSAYRIEKSKAEDSPSYGDASKFDYFENKHLDIIEFKDSKFVIRQ
jgi:hypothetical protein